MRAINYFVITRTELDSFAITEESFKRGMMYPAPHMLVHKDDPEAKLYSMARMRPMSERCANIRDSELNNTGYGIVVRCSSKDMDAALKRAVGIVIKSVADDIGIKDYQIVSDEVNEDNFVDTFELSSIIATIPSIFNKRI